MTSRNADEAIPKPAGWYENPDDPSNLRYFDGEVWTEFTHPKVDQQQAPGTPTANGMASAQGDGKKTPNKILLTAIAALVVLGLSSAVAFWPSSRKDEVGTLPPTPEIEESAEPAQPEPVDEPEEEEPEEEPEEEVELPPGPADIVYLSEEAAALEYGKKPRFEWAGRMLGVARIDSPQVVAAGWMPGMTGLNVCRLNPLKGPEDFAGGGVSGKNVDLIAPLEGEDFTAYLLFSATTPTEGLEPEQTTTYILPIDMETCEADERIDLTGPVDKELDAARPKFAGADSSVLAVAPYPNSVTRYPDVPALFGFDTKTKTVVWERSAPNTSFKVIDDYDKDVKRVPYVLDVKEGTADTQSLLLVEDGAALVQSTFFTAPIVSMGDDRFLYTTRAKSFKGGEDSQAIFDVKQGESTPVERYLGPNAQAGLDDNGAIIAVGYLCNDLEKTCAATNGAALGYIDAEGRATELLASSQVEDLSAKFLGFANGLVYVSTDSETITIDLDGNQVGKALNPALDPYRPVQDLFLPGETWTLWEVPSNTQTSSHYAVTRDGELPDAPAE